MEKVALVSIVPFTNDHKSAIKTLNEEWLQLYFKIEDEDAKVLSDPQKYIIDQGGRIYYALLSDVIVGTVSLIKKDAFTYELSKMAVSSLHQGLGIGEKLLEHAILQAENMQLKTLVLYSNRKLKSALHLYQKHGFIEVPMGATNYERADIKMEKNLS